MNPALKGTHPASIICVRRDAEVQTCTCGCGREAESGCTTGSLGRGPRDEVPWVGRGLLGFLRWRLCSRLPPCSSVAQNTKAGPSCPDHLLPSYPAQVGKVGGRGGRSLPGFSFGSAFFLTLASYFTPHPHPVYWETPIGSGDGLCPGGLGAVGAGAPPEKP